jgi:hypothetical protein
MFEFLTFVFTGVVLASTVVSRVAPDVSWQPAKGLLMLANMLSLKLKGE